MYGLIKSAAASLLMPLPIMAAGFTLGLMVFWTGRRRVGVAMCSAAVGGLLLLSWAPVADRLLGPLESQYPSLPEISDSGHLEAIVVLGGGWQPDVDRPASVRLSDSSALRLMEGVRLWRQQPELPLMVTGTSRNPEEDSIAAGYEQAALALGVPKDRIVRLDWPVDTGQEALAVAEQLGEGARMVLVTSASHMPRSMAHFERAGLQPVAAPTQFAAGRDPRRSIRYWVPAATHLHKSERAIYESLGLLALRWEANRPD